MAQKDSTARASSYNHNEKIEQRSQSFSRYTVHTGSIEPANIELLELYHRDVQYLKRLAQLNCNN